MSCAEKLALYGTKGGDNNKCPRKHPVLCFSITHMNGKRVAGENLVARTLFLQFVPWMFTTTTTKKMLGVEEINNVAVRGFSGPAVSDMSSSFF